MANGQFLPENYAKAYQKGRQVDHKTPIVVVVVVAAN